MSHLCPQGLCVWLLPHLRYLASRTAIVWGTAACRWDLGQQLQTVVKKLSFLDPPPCVTASNPSQHYPQPARCSSVCVCVWVSACLCVCVGNKSTAPTLHCHSCRAAPPSSRPGTHTHFVCDLSSPDSSGQGAAPHEKVGTHLFYCAKLLSAERSQLNTH